MTSKTNKHTQQETKQTNTSSLTLNTQKSLFKTSSNQRMGPHTHIHTYIQYTNTNRQPHILWYTHTHKQTDSHDCAQRPRSRTICISIMITRTVGWGREGVQLGLRGAGICADEEISIILLE